MPSLLFFRVCFDFCLSHIIFFKNLFTDTWIITTLAFLFPILVQVFLLNNFHVVVISWAFDVSAYSLLWFFLSSLNCYLWPWFVVFSNSFSFLPVFLDSMKPSCSSSIPRSGWLSSCSSLKLLLWISFFFPFFLILVVLFSLLRRYIWPGPGSAFCKIYKLLGPLHTSIFSIPLLASSTSF